MDNCILELKKLFCCCAPINELKQLKIKEKEDGVISIDIQKKIVANTVNNILIKEYPIKYSYQRAFMKLLISQLEQNGDEIDDDVFVAYGNIVSLPEKDIHYRHFLQENGDLQYITIQESVNIISKGTTGLCVWQGALHLATWCLKNRSKFLGKSILELGCGVGLTGLSIINTCSPKRYIFSDCHENVLDMLCENIRFNLLSLQERISIDARLSKDRSKLHIKYSDTDVKVVELKWEDINKYTNEDSTVHDVIIGADILYESSSFYSLLSGLNLLLKPTNCAIIAATIRNEDTLNKFLSQLGEHSLTYLECDISEQSMFIESSQTPVKILQIFKKTEIV
ncbi:hypothetical protein KPH14_004082 [Odynerus spinipes]|uniref:FAM86 N-terminal domain-containing protein n=1 Tax=Odynerus spinipes TaxID=1348599 RepID=A0AAD9RYT5_9HYME|nr:hypothetical protein KPH14_004082 [Odynerus spinipes]